MTWRGTLTGELEAALLTANNRRLILYEPPVVPLLPPALVDRGQCTLFGAP